MKHTITKASSPEAVGFSNSNNIISNTNINNTSGSSNLLAAAVQRRRMHRASRVNVANTNNTNNTVAHLHVDSTNKLHKTYEMKGQVLSSSSHNTNGSSGTRYSSVSSTYLTALQQQKKQQHHVTKSKSITPSSFIPIVTPTHSSQLQSKAKASPSINVNISATQQLQLQEPPNFFANDDSQDVDFDHHPRNYNYNYTDNNANYWPEEEGVSSVIVDIHHDDNVVHNKQKNTQYQPQQRQQTPPPSQLSFRDKITMFEKHKTGPPVSQNITSISNIHSKYHQPSTTTSTTDFNFFKDPPITSIDYSPPVSPSNNLVPVLPVVVHDALTPPPLAPLPSIIPPSRVAARAAKVAANYLANKHKGSSQTKPNTITNTNAHRGHWFANTVSSNDHDHNTNINSNTDITNNMNLLLADPDDFEEYYLAYQQRRDQRQQQDMSMDNIKHAADAPGLIIHNRENTNLLLLKEMEERIINKMLSTIDHKFQEMDLYFQQKLEQQKQHMEDQMDILYQHIMEHFWKEFEKNSTSTSNHSTNKEGRD